MTDSYGSEYDLSRGTDFKKPAHLLLQPPDTLSQSVAKDQTPHGKSRYFLESQLSGTMPTSKSANHPQLTNFEGDMEEETEKSLKRRNVALREEMKKMSVELTELLAKQKPTRPIQTPKTSMSVSSHNAANSEEIRLHLQLETAHKQLSNYQKEYDHLKNKTDDYLDPLKRIQVTEKVYEVDERIEKATGENRQLNKLIRERGKEIEQLQRELEDTRKEANINDMMVAMTRKYRDVISNQNKLKEQSEQKESYIQKVENEIMKIKEQYDFAAKRTGYEKPEQKRTSKAKSVSRLKKLEFETGTPVMTPRNISTTWKQREDECDDMRYNVENFEKLQSKLKISKKSNIVKEKGWRREMHNLHGQMIAKDKERHEAKTSLLEVEREIEILNSVFRELNSISMRHNTQLPSKKMMKIKKLDDIGSNALSVRTKEKIHLPQISTRSHRSEKKPKIQKVHEEKIEKVDKVDKVEKVQKVVKAGKVSKVEKIERLEKGDESEFNDRDLVKNQGVRIVGLKVWYDLQNINGIQALYETFTGNKFEGNKHGLNLYKYRVARFEMEGDEYLKDLTGYFNKEGTAVVCLIFKSSTGEIRKVGQTPENGRQFKFDVGENEFPAIIYGSIYEENNESVLSRLGVLIASEEDFPEVVRTDDEAEMFDDVE